MGRSILFLSAAILVLFSASGASADARVGTITFIEGVVDISGNGKEAALAGENQPVFLNDRIRTKSFSKAEIVLEDKSVLKLAPASCISVEEFVMSERAIREKCRVKLARGKIEAVVSKTGAQDTFVIDTPNAKGSVKGSDIFVSYMAGRTGVFVREGAIAVSNISAVSSGVKVSRGDCVFVSFDESPGDVRPMLDIELVQHKRDVERELLRKWIPAGDSERMRAVVVSASGTARIFKRGTGDWGQVRSGDTIGESDKIQTGSDGAVQIKFGNGNSLFLQPGTELFIETLRVDPESGSYSNTFEMKQGEVIGVIEKLDGKSTFQVKTPTAVSGVRGTVLRVVLPPSTPEIPFPKTQVFLEGGSGIVTSVLTGKTQELFAGQNVSVDLSGNISVPVLTPVNDRIQMTAPVFGKPVEQYSAPKPIAGMGAEPFKNKMPPPLDPVKKEGMKRPPLIDHSVNNMALASTITYQQVFKPIDPNVLIQIPFVKAAGTNPSINLANLDLVLKKDGTWSAAIKGDFVSSVGTGWDLRFASNMGDAVEFNHIQSSLNPGSSGIFDGTGVSFTGSIVGTEPDKSLALSQLNGSYSGNRISGEAWGTWTDSESPPPTTSPSMTSP